MVYTHVHADKYPYIFIFITPTIERVWADNIGGYGGGIHEARAVAESVGQAWLLGL